MGKCYARLLISQLLTPYGSQDGDHDGSWLGSRHLHKVSGVTGGLRPAVCFVKQFRQPQISRSAKGSKGFEASLLKKDYLKV